MGKFIDLTGSKFGRWTVLSRADRKNDTYWNCICECGKKKEVVAYTLNKGISLSCGCLRNELSSSRTFVHGCIGTPEYIAWRGLIYRCEDEKSKSFQDYGERGIEVCERWRSSFTNFLSDMGERPTSKHSIDRINVNGNYEPSNCRWATKEEQMHNRRVVKTNKTGVSGVFFNNKLNKYISSIGVNGGRKYLGCFVTLEEATEAREKAEEYYWNKD